MTSMATGSVAGSQRFKISIKSAEEVQGQQKGDLGPLRAAALVGVRPSCMVACNYRRLSCAAKGLRVGGVACKQRQ